jgi:hypothetical protein
VRLNVMPMRLPPLLLACVLVLSACDSVTLSPRQKVVKEAQRAMCDSRSLKGMLPYVSEKSRPMLELASSMAELGTLLSGQSLADRIAIECTGSGPDFVDEVRVTDVRYIVRTRTPGQKDLTETIVVLEGGVWKIALQGK